jgi:hypothetical protein
MEHGRRTHASKREWSPWDVGDPASSRARGPAAPELTHLVVRGNHPIGTRAVAEWRCPMSSAAGRNHRRYPVRKEGTRARRAAGMASREAGSAAARRRAGGLTAEAKCLKAVGELRHGRPGALELVGQRHATERYLDDGGNMAFRTHEPHAMTPGREARYRLTMPPGHQPRSDEMMTVEAPDRHRMGRSGAMLVAP